MAAFDLCCQVDQEVDGKIVYHCIQKVHFDLISQRVDWCFNGLHRNHERPLDDRDPTR